MAPQLASAPPLGMALRHVRRLAALHGATPEAIAETVSLWPLGARMLLSVYMIVDFDLGDDAADRGHPLSTDEIVEAARTGEPVDCKLTEYGLTVIAECARWCDTYELPEPLSGEWPERLATSSELEDIDPAFPTR
jgi:hypothetical protein